MLLLHNKPQMLRQLRSKPPLMLLPLLNSKPLPLPKLTLRV